MSAGSVRVAMALSAAHARPVPRRRRGVAAWTAPLVLAGLALVPDPAVDLTADDTRKSAATTAALSMVSVTPAGKPANGHSAAFSNSGGPSISATGRYAVFSSYATDLVTPPGGPPGGQENIYWRDLVSGKTERVDPRADGSSWTPSVSADGRFVAFRSQATNLGPGAPGNYSALYVRDMTNATITLVALRAALWAQISADGGTVVFASDGDGLPNRTDAPAGRRWTQVYAWNRVSGAVTVVSTDATGAPAAADAERPRVSADGRFVAFGSYVVDPKTYTYVRPPEVYLRDLSSPAAPVLVSRINGKESGGANLAGDTVVSDSGDRVVFTAGQAYLWDRSKGAPVVSVVSDGRQWPGGTTPMLVPSRDPYSA